MTLNNGDTEMASTTPGHRPQRVFIFDNPRTRSHLFFRLMATHPAFGTRYHPYVLAGVLGPEKPHYDINHENPGRSRLIRETWEPYCKDELNHANADRALLEGFAAIEAEGKIPLANEHCSLVVKRQICIDHVTSRQPLDSASLPANPTVLPDTLWESVTPVILIRHPAHAIPSTYRATLGLPFMENLDPLENQNYLSATLTWARVLFEVLQRQGRTPIVVDGDDVCTRTSEVMERLCHSLGLDPAGMSDTWEAWGPNKERLHPLFTEMTRTIWESEGIKKYKPTGPISIDAAVEDFQAEFGDDLGANMRIAIEEQMDNYHFLEHFKL